MGPKWDLKFGKWDLNGRSAHMLDGATDPYAIFGTYITNGKRRERMSSEKLLTVYRRLAEKDINILQARYTRTSPTGGWYTLTIEYGYIKRANNKLIWPKITATGSSLVEAVEEAERLVDAIREA